MSSVAEDIFNDLLHIMLLNTIIFGFLGNFWCFRIFSSSTLHKHPISIFFRVISIVDSLMLIDGFTILIYQRYGFSFMTASDFFCKLKGYFFYSLGPISPWLMVIISLERFVTISYPKKFPFLFKLSVQIFLICVIGTWNFVFYSFMAWNSVLVSVLDNSTGSIQMKCEQNFNTLALQWMDFFNSTIVPFIAMLIISVALIHLVRVSRARVHVGSNFHSKKDNRFAISAVTLNLIFLVLNLPIVIDDLISVSAVPDHFFDYFATNLYFLYYAINFYAQMVVNSEFRNEFFKILNLKVRTANFDQATNHENSHTANHLPHN